MNIKDKDLVVTSNRYVEASYFFTANEEKIMTAMRTGKFVYDLSGNAR